MIRKDTIDLFRVPPGKQIRLQDYDPGWTQAEETKRLGKNAIKERDRVMLEKNLEALAEAQQLFYASNTYSLLIIFQAMDAGGKDSMIKHVMSGMNPQGCQVYSFKVPSEEELDHNFLWRYMKALPERGRIGIFNRSYYEEVLVVRVHPEWLDKQRLPPGKRGKSFWEGRYQDINALENHLARNGTHVLKFFLHISKDEQKKRFLERLNDPEKHWKFSADDLGERAYWEQYMRAYENVLNATSTEWAPWYVIPADHKWVARALVADVISTTIQSLDLSYPALKDEQLQALEEARKRLENE